MVRRLPLIAVCLLTVAAPLAAQPAPEQEANPPELAGAPQPRSMVGSWEFSNADREKTCTIVFRDTAAKAGKRVEFDPNCANVFSFIPEIAGWRFTDSDFLRLLDAQGNSLLEFSEVESGIFEAPKPGEGILFIQNPSGLGAPPKTAEQIKGEWNLIRRTGQRICSLTLSDTAAGEEFVVRVQSGCDAAVTRFGVVTWQMDRGEIVLRSASGQSWRFEEGDDGRWQRIPQSATPLLMVRK